MQQRRVRLGDILDDYCPRERRITNHAVVAMVEDTVKQTRCTTCDADHEYREAKMPAPRRRKTGALTSDDIEAGARPRPAVVSAEDETIPAEELVEAAEAFDPAEPLEVEAAEPAPEPVQESTPEDAETPADSDQDEWPVHRPLIRATLPRPEGQTPERKAPDFTFRPAGGRFDSNRNGHRKPGHRPARQAQGQPSGGGQGRFGGSRSGSGQGPRHGAGQGQGPGQRQGNRPGPAAGGRPGQGRGPRPGGGGRKRGR